MRVTEPLLEGLLYLLMAGCLLLGHGWPELGGSGFEAGPKPGEALRIVTWNVGGAGGADDSGGHPLEEESIPTVVATLQDLKPDLVVLQEVASRGQLDRLLRGLGRDEWSSAMRRGGGRRVAALSFGGQLEPFWYGSSSVLGLVLHVKGFAPVAVVGLHADAYSSSKRNQSVGEAADRLLRRSEPGGRILLGDFNLDVDLDRRRDLFSDDAHLDVETYNYVATRLEDVARGRGSTAEPDRRLDYLFVDERLMVSAAGPLRDRRVGDMDHDPVVADLIPAR